MKRRSASAVLLLVSSVVMTGCGAPMEASAPPRTEHSDGLQAPARPPTEVSGVEDPLTPGFAAVPAWARAGYPNTDVTLGPLQLGRGCGNCGRAFYKAAVADPPRFARGLVAADDPKVTAAMFMNVGLEYGMGEVVKIARELDTAEPHWEAGMNVVAAEALDHYDSHHGRGGAELAYEARRHGRAAQSSRARAAALYVMVRMTPRDPLLTKTLAYVPWDGFREWYGEPMSPDDLEAYVAIADDAWERADLYCDAYPALSQYGVRDDRYFARLGAPFDTTMLEAMLDTSPHAFGIATRMWPFLTDDKAQARMDVMARHVPALVELARGPQVCGRRQACARDGVRAQLAMLIDQLRAQHDEKGLAKLHDALVASVSGGELDAALGDLVLRAASTASTKKK